MKSRVGTPLYVAPEASPAPILTPGPSPSYSPSPAPLASRPRHNLSRSMARVRPKSRSRHDLSRGGARVRPKSRSRHDLSRGRARVRPKSRPRHDLAPSYNLRCTNHVGIRRESATHIRGRAGPTHPPPLLCQPLCQPCWRRSNPSH